MNIFRFYPAVRAIRKPLYQIRPAVFSTDQVTISYNMFTGSLLLESFFGVPGLGFAGVDALYNSDIQLLNAIVVMSAILFVVINLLADLAYAWADPRIRLE